MTTSLLKGAKDESHLRPVVDKSLLKTIVSVSLITLIALWLSVIEMIKCVSDKVCNVVINIFEFLVKCRQDYPL